MRNSTSGSTSKANTVQNDSVSNAEKTSAKKLKQARLPFKIIAPGTSPVGPKTTATPVAADNDEVKDTTSTEGRKRKLSFDDTDEDGSGGSANVVIEADNNVSKENVELLKAAVKKKKLSAVCNDESITEVVSLLDDDDDDGVCSKEDCANSIVSGAGRKDIILKTPKAIAKSKQKGAGTPETSNAQKDKHGSATKLQIKLPLSSGKKKRRKSKLQQLSLNNSIDDERSHHNSAQEISSDDIEDFASDLNPQKRKKLNTEEQNGATSIEVEKTCDDQKKEVDNIVLDSEPQLEEEEKGKHIETNEATKALREKNNLANEKSQKTSKASDKSSSNTTSKDKEANQATITTSSSEKSSPKEKSKESAKTSEDDYEENIEISDSSEQENDEKPEDNKKDLDESVLGDNEADDETANESLKHHNTIEIQKDSRKATSSAAKNLTPRQMKLMDQRKKAREEKERKLQEEKMKKQQEKEEKELAKKREREEKEEQRRKEREEKEEQKRKERDEKERKRLADIEAKNEEKRKKNEAKEEELRKKEEERKRKEQEKEEAELKKKKAAQAFTKFFVPKIPANVQIKNEEDSNTGDDTRLLAFRPFQVKGDMKLAPISRKTLTEQEKNHLDNLLGCRNADGIEHDDAEDEEEIVKSKALPRSELYLSELHSGKILPGKWRRRSTESKDDVIVVEDELERVGQEIVEDTPAYIREEMRVKFYKFHDNRRPPYYGTWRKKSSVVRPRKPFAQDKKFFDYEVDSDDEWEEEEPGESLEDGSDDDKEKESEDDDYEVDNEWFVPHGHLSDEELQNQDEFGMNDDNTREAQKVKLQILQQEFAQEMKKKTEKIKPRLIGCIWADINGNQPANCAKILWDTLEKKAMLFTGPPLIEEPEIERSTEPSSPSGPANGIATTDKLKPIALTDNMVKDLTRLIHGNNHSKNFLINEYIAFIEKTEESVKNGDQRKPLKSVVRDKIDEMAEWQVVDASNTDDTAANVETTKKKKKAKRRLCWVVKQEMLNKMNLSSLELKNAWEYTLPPKFVKADNKEIRTDESNASSATSYNESPSTSTTPVVAEGKNAAATPQIKKFTKVLTAEEKASKLQKTPASTNTSANDKIGTERKSNTPTTAKEKKRVPLLMSVARGQQISTPTKNKLISQFLQQKNKDNSTNSSSSSSPASRSKTVTSPHVENDDVVILDD